MAWHCRLTKQEKKVAEIAQKPLCRECVYSHSYTEADVNGNPFLCKCRMDEGTSYERYYRFLNLPCQLPTPKFKRR